MQAALRAYLGLIQPAFDFTDENIAARLESLARACRALLGELTVEINSAPVMRSSDAFWARLDHRTTRVVLNGFALASSPDAAAMRDFLLLHESFHLWVLRNPGMSAEWAELGAEEEVADLVAWFALSALAK